MPFLRAFGFVGSVRLGVLVAWLFNSGFRPNPTKSDHIKVNQVEKKYYRHAGCGDRRSISGKSCKIVANRIQESRVQSRLGVKAHRTGYQSPAHSNQSPSNQIKVDKAEKTEPTDREPLNRVALVRSADLTDLTHTWAARLILFYGKCRFMGEI